MNPSQTRVHELRGDAVSFTEEARRIQHRALDGQASVVRLGQIVFFSTKTGDAWMLDAEDGYAVCLARNFEARPIPIQETPAKLEIGWNADYRIEGEIFTVAEGDGAARAIQGYPIAEIQRLSRESPATPTEPSSDADEARERLKCGRNDPCPCGSGKKYKKCCLARDEALVRESALEPGPRTAGRAGRAALMTGGESAPASGGAASSDPADSGVGIASKPLTEADRKVDALWEEIEAWKQPTTEQMDAMLANLLALPPEATGWNELFHRLARHKHPDLPGVFRRIAAAVPHTKETDMAFFYWAAAEEFVRGQVPQMLPEVAASWRKLDRESYNPDALFQLEDYLLAGGFETESLELAEQFLPVLRADNGLMPHVVPELCGLLFDLRVGRHLRADSDSTAAPDLLAEELRLDIEEEISLEAAHGAAEVIVGRSSVPGWGQSQFNLVSRGIRSDDAAMRQTLRLSEVLIHVAREAWHVEQRPSGCALRGLTLLLDSVYQWLGTEPKKRKNASRNLLDYLRPAGLEQRLVEACRDIVGVNEPRARLLLDAHGILLRFAERHQLVADAHAAESRKELVRLQHALDRLD